MEGKEVAAFERSHEATVRFPRLARVDDDVLGRKGNGESVLHETGYTTADECTFLLKFPAPYRAKPMR